MMLTGKMTNRLQGRRAPLKKDVNGICLMTELKLKPFLFFTLTVLQTHGNSSATDEAA